MHRQFRTAVVIGATVLLAGRGAFAQECPGDLNGDGQVAINEIITAVNSALNGCSVVPPATPTPAPITLESLIGQWTFYVTSLKWQRSFSFEELVSRPNGELLFGLEIGTGLGVTVSYNTDPHSRYPFVLTYDRVKCDVYVFDMYIVAGGNKVSGSAYPGEGGIFAPSCETQTARSYPMDGTRK